MGLAMLDCPVSVLHGLHDPTRTPDQARELAAAIPGARLRLLDTGHTPANEDPDGVATELLALLARWQERSTPTPRPDDLAGPTAR
jgi:pimeloyl-ACP methyl ester carboxylesterase